MPSIPTGMRDRIQEVVDRIQDPDSPFADELKAMYWFHAYAWEQIAELGGQERGYNFRQRDEQCLMVYKATFNDTPVVVFTTAQNATRCIQSFCRRLFANSLEWKKDKYS